MDDILEELSKINKEKADWFEATFEPVGILTDKGEMLYYSEWMSALIKQQREYLKEYYDGFNKKPSWQDISKHADEFAKERGYDIIIVNLCFEECAKFIAKFK